METIFNFSNIGEKNLIYPIKTAATLRNRSYSRLSYGLREATPTKHRGSP